MDANLKLLKQLISALWTVDRNSQISGQFEADVAVELTLLARTKSTEVALSL